MRRISKVDANQPEIVAALRKLGASVQPLHAVGQGVPDLLAGFRGQDVKLEVKDGAKPPSARKLTPDQIDWHGNWRGSPVHVVTSIEEAVAAVLGLRDG